METYSQFNQDLHVIQNIYNKKECGYFVDIGAYDGVNMSNTYLLEKNYNWKGICIEANPRYFDKLEKIRTSININTAIYIDDNSELDFIDDTEGGCSGLQKTNSHTFLNDRPIIKVKTKNLTNLLDEHNAPNFIDYLSIDTEGSEYDILSSHNFNKYKFGYITVEHNFINTNRMKIRELLINNGYRFYRENSVDDDYILDFKGIFYNSKKALCSIHESGLMVYNTLKNSPFYNLTYSEDTEFSYDYDFAIVNDHYTVNNWITKKMIEKFQKPIFCIVTEVTFTENYIDKSPSFYTAYIVLDPSINEKNNVYGFPRPLEDNTTVEYSDNIVPIIGSFGFATTGKNWHKIVEQTQNEFEEAIVRFNIPFATYVPDSQLIINDVIQTCNAVIKNPKIKLEITHNNFTKQELINWCAQNTINCFLYNREHLFSAGLCATTDQAIVSEKPLLVSNDSTFRHIHKYIDYYPNISIKQAILQTQDGVKRMKQEWSSKNFTNKFENILFKYNKINNINEINSIKKAEPIKQIYTILGLELNAYYHINNYTEDGNVSEIVYNLFNKFIEKNQNIFKVSNDIFSNTYPDSFKSLFLNLRESNNTYTLICNEGNSINWIEIVKHIHNILKNRSNIDTTNLIQVSIGEIIDKYSILELKKKYITDTNKINEIQKEMDILNGKVPKQSEFYKQLLYINEKIWLDTDKIKEIKYDSLNSSNNIFAKLSNNIFENNQKRFRLKNYFNILEKSTIKECKSYSDNKCFIRIFNEDDIFNKIPEINYLCISYDIIYFDIKFKDVITRLFKNSNIYFIDEDKDKDKDKDKDEDKNININNTTATYELAGYSINNDDRSFFEFETIKYKSAGKLGDFLNQLSVVCEKFYETGRKGELYITDLDNPNDKFVFGLENTFNDTYSVISSQIFIKDYKIYSNQPIDIDLSVWRNNVWEFINKGGNWYTIFNKTYNINWNKHKCLSFKNDIKWSDKIIINITPYRFISTEAINNLKDKIENNLQDCVFISNEEEHYHYFINKTNINIDYYKPNNFDETVTIINSCKIGFFGFSSMAVIANILHKEYYAMGIINTDDFTLNNLKNVCPFILDIFG